MTTRQCDGDDHAEILAIINDAAEAYRGVIPADCFHDPYMSAEALKQEIDAGVRFWGTEIDGSLVAVMGIQVLDEVALIRHAYVRTAKQGEGLGTDLLRHLRAMSRKPMLVGTWAAAARAIGFYERHGFERVAKIETAVLLKRHWSIPERQIETSVVLVEKAPALSGQIAPAST